VYLEPFSSYSESDFLLTDALHESRDLDVIDDVTGFSTGNDATNRFVDHGFLLVFNTCFLSTVYRSLVIRRFFNTREVNNGRLFVDFGR
jgi:hypothetical protein